uniref:Uncharacterized protein n=1 Tax=Ciona savignyi TaxID=51511 RepID=H2Z4T1_CIOSA
NADRVILVDRQENSQNKRKKNDFYEVPYNRDRIDISDEELCEHSDNDVNYYVVCRHFLTGTWSSRDGKVFPGGLLHHPEELSVFVSQLYVLLDICSRGRRAVAPERRSLAPSMRRLAANQLRKTLQRKRVCSAKFRYRYPECEMANEEGVNLASIEIQWIH